MKQLRNLNFCLHDIVPSQGDVDGVYTLTDDQLKEVIEVGSDAIDKGIADILVLYFDDSYASFMDRVLSVERPSFCTLNAAVITNTINTPDHLTEQDIRSCSQAGVAISSHGVSHAALAIFDKDDVLLPTPPDGAYQNTPFGNERVLNENEVLYQLIESQIRLEKLVAGTVKELVLPFGLYNSQTLDIIEAYTDFTHVTSCHSAIDIGQQLRPRHLITQQNIGQLAVDISNLTETFTPLF